MKVCGSTTGKPLTLLTIMLIVIATFLVESCLISKSINRDSNDRRLLSSNAGTNMLVMLQAEGSSSEVPINMTVKFLDVGLGDSCIVKVENEGNVFFALIDCGKSEDSQIVISELTSMECSSVNVLVLTNPNDEHIGGAMDVMNAFPIGEVWEPGIDGINTESWLNTMSIIAAKGIRRVNPRAGETYDWGGATTQVLNPPEGATYSETNDWSIVNVVTLGEQDLMFTGDIGSAAQEFILSSSFPKIEIIKVPEHGTDWGSNELLWEVDPKYGIISADKDSNIRFHNYQDQRINFSYTFSYGHIIIKMTASNLQIDFQEYHDLGFVFWALLAVFLLMPYLQNLVNFILNYLYITPPRNWFYRRLDFICFFCAVVLFMIHIIYNSSVEDIPPLILIFLLFGGNVCMKYYISVERERENS